MREKPVNKGIVSALDEIIKKAPIDDDNTGQIKTILVHIPEHYHTKLKLLSVQNKIKLRDLMAKILIDFVDKIP